MSRFIIFRFIRKQFTISSLFISFLCLSCTAQTTNYDEFELDSRYPYLDVSEYLVPNIKKRLNRIMPVTVSHFFFDDYEAGSFEYKVVHIKNQQELDNFLHLHEKRKEKAVRLEFTDFSKISLVGLEDVEFLDICSTKSKAFPSNMDKLKNLKTLKISMSKLDSIPDCIGEFSNLNRLIIDYNDDLVYLPKSLEQLTELRHLNLSRLHRIEFFPLDLSKFTQLETLTFDDNKTSFSSIASISKLSCLTYLSVDDYNLEISSLKNLELLSISRNLSNDEVGNLSEIKSLKELTVGFDEDSSAIHLANLTNLRTLSIRSDVESLPNELEVLSELQFLSITSDKIKEIPSFVKKLEKIKYLVIRIMLSKEEFNLSYDLLKECTARYYHFIGKIRTDFESKIVVDSFIEPEIFRNNLFLFTVKGLDGKKFLVYKD